jgi:putative nucleotidyltransferase with HDIG domain
VRVSVYVVPFVASVLAAVLLSAIVPPAVTWPIAVIRLIAIAACSTVVLYAVDKATRKALPLAVLLDLTLVFPDEAPSRFRVALRSGGPRTLEQRLEEYRALGDEEPARAAEELLELVAALSRHDRRTRGHSERVRAYAHLIGEELGLKADEVDKLQWAALLHDIGKLEIPEAILNKPGRLDAAEYEIVKTHPEIGAILAAPLANWLGDWVRAVGEHHERWDGGGYPLGLREYEIALGARIVAVADTFDVMTSIRSYQTAGSATVARQELADCAGSQFDPAIVRAFLSVSLGRLRMAMGPLSWLTQLSLFPPGIVSAGVAPTMTAVAGFTAAAVGIGASPAEFVKADRPAYIAEAETPDSSFELDVVASRTVDSSEGTPTTVPVRGQVAVAAAAETGNGSTADLLPSTTSTTSPSTIPATTPSTFTITTVDGTLSTTTTAVTLPGSAPTTTSPRSSVSTVAPVPVVVTIPPATSPGATPTTPTLPTTPTPPTTPTLPTVPTLPTTTTSTTTTTTTTSTTTTTLPASATKLLLGSSGPGDVASQAVLPLVSRAAINANLPNFDTDRDNENGLKLRKDGTFDINENPERIQRFRFEPIGSFILDGPAQASIWLGAKNLHADDIQASVALMECTDVLEVCAPVASDTIDFVGLKDRYSLHTFDFGNLVRVVPSARHLQLWVIATLDSKHDMWVAYDTTGYESMLVLNG